MDSLDSHLESFKSIITNQRLAQSLLFVGSDLHFIETLTRKLIQIVFCDRGGVDACKQCSNCLMVEKNEHPDITYITPEKPGSAIKIDQIRLLQTEIYQTPQRGKSRFILLKSAELMNKAAANALLKIIEEPPMHTHFVLLAEQITTIPATIISRCQIWRFNVESQHDPLDFWQFKVNYVDKESRLDILQKCEQLCSDLLSLLKKQTIPTLVAMQWKDLVLRDLLWFLYLVYAQIISIKTLPEKPFSGLTILNAIAEPIKLQKIFQQIDKINALQKKLSHNVNMNPTLVIEDLLMDFCQGVE